MSKIQDAVKAVNGVARAIWDSGNRNSSHCLEKAMDETPEVREFLSNPSALRRIRELAGEGFAEESRQRVMASRGDKKQRSHWMEGRDNY